jgi:hypothetical protein
MGGRLRDVLVVLIIVAAVLFVAIGAGLLFLPAGPGNN